MQLSGEHALNAGSRTITCDETEWRAEDEIGRLTNVLGGELTMYLLQVHKESDL